MYEGRGLTGMKRIGTCIEAIRRQLTWKRLLAIVGLFGLLYMLFVPTSRDPALIIVFFTMLGIGPLATADQRSADGKDDSGERRRHDDE